MGAASPTHALTLTLFQAKGSTPSARALKGSRTPATWSGVIRRLLNPDRWPATSDDDHVRERLPAWAFAEFRHDTRSRAAVERVHALVFDYEDPLIDGDELLALWPRHTWAAHTTASHDRSKTVSSGGGLVAKKAAMPRWRLILPYRRPVSADEHEQIARHIRAHWEVGAPTNAGEQPHQVWYQPIEAPGGYEHARHNGDLLDVDGILLEVRQLPVADLHLRVALAALWERPATAGFCWPGTQGIDAPDGSLLEATAVLPPDQGYAGPSWSDLHALVGGLGVDRLAMLVGEPGCGKTAFALQMAESVARAGHPVFYVTTQTSVAEIAARLLALRSRGAVPYSAVLARKVPIAALSAASRRLLADCPHLFVWAPLVGHGDDDGLSTKLRAVSAAHGGRPPFVVIDELSRFRRVEDVAMRLRAIVQPGGLADDWPGAAVLTVDHQVDAQVARSCVAVRKAFEAGDLIPGVRPVQLVVDASLLLILGSCPERCQKCVGRAKITVAVAKNRYGKAGLTELEYLAACGRFVQPSTPPAVSAPPTFQDPR